MSRIFPPSGARRRFRPRTRNGISPRTVRDPKRCRRCALPPHSKTGQPIGNSPTKDNTPRTINNDRAAISYS